MVGASLGSIRDFIRARKRRTAIALILVAAIAAIVLGPPIVQFLASLAALFSIIAILITGHDESGVNSWQDPTGGGGA